MQLELWCKSPWVKTGSGISLLPDSTNPLPEPMLTYHQWGPVSIGTIFFIITQDDIESQPLPGGRMVVRSHTCALRN